MTRELLCRCTLVSVAEVETVIRDGATSVEDVGRRCDAGTGCGSCHRAIQVLLKHQALRRAARQRRVNSAYRDQIRLFAGVSDE